MRGPITLKIKFKSISIEDFIRRHSVDVNHDGIFVRTKQPLEVGLPVRFEFQLSDATPIILGDGTVAWARPYDANQPSAPPPGMGVHFERLTAASQQVLERILAEKRRRGERMEQARYQEGLPRARTTPAPFDPHEPASAPRAVPGLPQAMLHRPGPGANPSLSRSGGPPRHSLAPGAAAFPDPFADLAQEIEREAGTGGTTAREPPAPALPPAPAWLHGLPALPERGAASERPATRPPSLPPRFASHALADLSRAFAVDDGAHDGLAGGAPAAAVAGETTRPVEAGSIESFAELTAASGATPGDERAAAPSQPLTEESTRPVEADSIEFEDGMVVPAGAALREWLAAPVEEPTRDLAAPADSDSDRAGTDAHGGGAASGWTGDGLAGAPVLPLPREGTLPVDTDSIESVAQLDVSTPPPAGEAATAGAEVIAASLEAGIPPIAPTWIAPPIEGATADSREPVATLTAPAAPSLDEVATTGEDAIVAPAEAAADSVAPINLTLPVEAGAAAVAEPVVTPPALAAPPPADEAPAASADALAAHPEAAADSVAPSSLAPPIEAATVVTETVVTPPALAAPPRADEAPAASADALAAHPEAAADSVAAINLTLPVEAGAAAVAEPVASPTAGETETAMVAASGDLEPPAPAEVARRAEQVALQPEPPAVEAMGEADGATAPTAGVSGESIAGSDFAGGKRDAATDDANGGGVALATVLPPDGPALESVSSPPPPSPSPAPIAAAASEDAEPARSSSTDPAPTAAAASEDAEPARSSSTDAAPTGSDESSQAPAPQRLEPRVAVLARVAIGPPRGAPARTRALRVTELSSPALRISPPPGERPPADRSASASANPAGGVAAVDLPLASHGEPAPASQALAAGPAEPVPEVPALAATLAAQPAWATDATAILTAGAVAVASGTASSDEVAARTAPVPAAPLAPRGLATAPAPAPAPRPRTSGPSTQVTTPLARSRSLDAPAESRRFPWLAAAIALVLLGGGSYYLAPLLFPGPASAVSTNVAPAKPIAP